MRALVTGATGFVGQALCRQLMADGVSVRASTRNPGHSGTGLFVTETIGVDAIDGRTDWTTALQGIDTVFHLAAVAHIVDHTEQDAAPYERVNADGTERLARDAARSGIRRFVLLSSLKVNGEASPAGGFREGESPRPEGAYALSKLHAEERLAGVAHETGLAYTIIRPPLVYGPRVRANFLALLRAVDRGRPLPFASVHNRRSLIYVENLCSALRAAATHPGAAGETFLVSDGEPVSTAELIRRLASALGRTARLFPVPPLLLQTLGAAIGKGDAIRKLTASLAIDDRKIRTSLGWRPTHDIDQGLADTAAWYRAAADQQ